MSPFSSARSGAPYDRSEWSSIARFWLEVTMMTCSTPAATASSTAYWMIGLSTSGSISLGCASVAGRERGPHTRAGGGAQLLGLRLRGGQEAGAPPGGREDGFSNAHRTSG